MDSSEMGQAKEEADVSLSSLSLNNSPKKCNLSFSLNFDFDDVNNDDSSDSETADLQIDVSEVDNYEPSSKHKREADEETSVINEMEEEIERQLDAKAAKTNLTATNVKNILKHVITNEHVMAMVQKRLHDEEDTVFERRFTRAKAKELAATQGNIPWSIAPVEKASFGVQVWMDEELPEDSSDEEYNPEQDKHSDDDREAENSTSSDVDSQPSTPATPAGTPSREQYELQDIQYDPEGIFKIPGIPHVPTEEESIGQRTRSKLCLSETPLEQIEQAFIPPDITTDMYDWNCELEENWRDFLKEFTQPLQQDPVIEDDPEVDPEYNNILEDEEDIVFEPKLTRAKAKELAATQGNIPCPITPDWMHKELPEESSDEEYNPEQDKHSDDDREAENSTSSDVDSQPSTPLNPAHTPSREKYESQDVQYDLEEILKIPGIPHVPTEEESIGQRTRSKLCLSETPLEQIEQAFIPPDITTDMYDWDCELEENWRDFLKEFTQPLQQDPVIEDDPEADPEYNISEDEETDLLDKEELRADKAVKITRKEVNDLIAELFEFTDTFSKQKQEVSKKRKPADNSNSSMENNSMNYSMVDLLPVLAEPELPKLVNLEQRKLLAIQFSQHVQLMTQHFAMTYMHPVLHSQAKTCKENLNSLCYLSNGPNSAFNAENLSDALKLVSYLEDKFLDEKFRDEYQRIIMEEENRRKVYRANKWKYNAKFHPELEKLFVESKALGYPQLLPLVPFTSDAPINNRYCPYLKSEESLIALGLEQFIPFVATRQKKFKSKKLQLMDTAQLIVQYLLPCRDPRSLLSYIQKRKRSKNQNPIKHYFEKGIAPRIVHYIPADNKLKAPKEQVRLLLPLRWQTYLNSIEQNIDVKQNRTLNSYNKALKKPHHTRQKYNMYSISDNHPLRNPVVNILPKILPANSNSKILNNNLAKDCLNDRSNISINSLQRKTSCNNNVQTMKCVTTNEQPTTTTTTTTTELASSQAGAKRVNTEVMQDVNETGKQLHTTIVKNSKVTKKSTDLLPQLPQLREMTPRLAKIRSAQNMKLMAQVSSPKNVSNCNAAKSKTKTDVDKNLEESCSLSKLDNEEEIAELMLASTTIKKDSLSRKKAKQARELENIKRLLGAENPLHEEERDAKFAGSYLQKLHLTLESTNPGVFRAVIKLCLDYNEKLDSINQSESESCISSESESLQTKNVDKQILNKDSLAINLYYNVCDKLKNYPELCTDFLLFLKPQQAAMIDKSVEYMMLQKMNEFVNVAQIYFAKQPSRLAKMMQAIAQLSSDPHVTLERVHAVMGPILKNHPLVMDLFLQVLPTGKPPESLFAPHLFENLTCPGGPHDKNKIYTDDAPELYENVELPISISQEDPYGGENCKCNCHATDSLNSKNSIEHCTSCGTRFLNGRIYLQTSEGLRPAKITFPGDDDEKIENTARVSLKTTDKFIPPAPTKQRRKSSKQDTTQDDPCQKDYPLKHSPTKDSEETEKSVPKPRKGARSPPKSGDQKKPLKRTRFTENIASSNKRLRTAQCKSKREKKIDKKEMKAEQKDTHTSDCTNVKDPTHSDSDHNTIRDNAIVGKGNVCINSVCNTSTYVENMNSKPWTRQEDMVLLQSIKVEYSENSFISVSEKLGDRTVEQVKERCQVLLSLLAKMT